MVWWCFDLDGRRERDERAKPTVGRAGNISNGIVAVFSLVRFQEKEMSGWKKGFKKWDRKQGIGLGCGR